MLDRRLIIEQTDTVRAALTLRHADDETMAAVDRIVEMDVRRKAVNTETDELRAKRNSLSKQIGPLMREGNREAAEPLKAEVKAFGDRLSALEDELKALETEQHDLMMRIPNVLDERVPAGKSEDDNQVVRTWGTPPSLDFEPKDHHDLGTDLGILDFAVAGRPDEAMLCFKLFRCTGPW